MRRWKIAWWLTASLFSRSRRRLRAVVNLAPIARGLEATSRAPGLRRRGIVLRLLFAPKQPVSTERRGFLAPALLAVEDAPHGRQAVLIIQAVALHVALVAHQQ